MANAGRPSKVIKRPPLFKYILEHIRVWKELWRSFQFSRKHQFEQQGDGHPVLVVPGFLGSDWSTKRIRKFIKKLGYTPYGWGLGKNLGDVHELDLLLKRMEEIAAKHQSKVTLIGWSLGGVYARQLAKERPELVRQLMTMGSPFAGLDKPNNAAWLYDIIKRIRPSVEADEKWYKDIPAPAPVPTSAIYSKNDGIVPWEACMEDEEDEIHQNIEITGCHFGLGHNVDVWMIVENRLPYAQENWQRMDEEKVLEAQPAS